MHGNSVPMSVMSTISFPNPHSPSHQDSPMSASQPVHFFPSSYDPHASASSFQINPLSMHPPRTPRTSLVTPRPKEEEAAEEEEEEEEEDEEELEARAGKRVRKEEVWREVLATSKGRDKALVSSTHARPSCLSTHGIEINSIFTTRLSCFPCRFQAASARHRSPLLGDGGLASHGGHGVWTVSRKV